MSSYWEVLNFTHGKINKDLQLFTICNCTCSVIVNTDTSPTLNILHFYIVLYNVSLKNSTTLLHWEQSFFCKPWKIQKTIPSLGKLLDMDELNKLSIKILNKYELHWVRGLSVSVLFITCICLGHPEHIYCVDFFPHFSAQEKTGFNYLNWKSIHALVLYMFWENPLVVLKIQILSQSRKTNAVFTQDTFTWGKCISQ